MRLDKYLKISRLIKRRTLAKEVVEKGRVEVNGRIAKASTTIKIDDEISIKYGQKIVKVKVLEIKETSKKDEASQMYSVISEEVSEND